MVVKRRTARRDAIQGEDSYLTGADTSRQFPEKTGSFSGVGRHRRSRHFTPGKSRTLGRKALELVAPAVLSGLGG
jgi:hypothetical protein